MLRVTREEGDTAAWQERQGRVRQGGLGRMEQGFRLRWLAQAFPLVFKPGVWAPLPQGLTCPFPPALNPAPVEITESLSTL